MLDSSIGGYFRSWSHLKLLMCIVHVPQYVLQNHPCFIFITLEVVRSSSSPICRCWIVEFSANRCTILCEVCYVAACCGRFQIHNQFWSLDRIGKLSHPVLMNSESCQNVHCEFHNRSFMRCRNYMRLMWILSFSFNWLDRSFPIVSAKTMLDITLVIPSILWLYSYNFVVVRHMWLAFIGFILCSYDHI